MKTKKSVKAKSKKGGSKAGKDEYGFLKGSKSGQAVRLLASGKAALKDVRKKFKTLSFGILLAQLEKNGFRVSENTQGLCSITAKGRVRQRPPIEAPAPGGTVAPGSSLQ